MRRLQDTLAQEKKEWNIKKQSLEAEEKEMKAMNTYKRLKNTLKHPT